MGGFLGLTPPPSKNEILRAPMLGILVISIYGYALFIALLVSSHYRIGPTLLNKIIVDKVDNDIYYTSYCCFCMRRFFFAKYQQKAENNNI